MVYVQPLSAPDRIVALVLLFGASRMGSYYIKNWAQFFARGWLALAYFILIIATTAPHWTLVSADLKERGSNRIAGDWSPGAIKSRTEKSGCGLTTLGSSDSWNIRGD
jgi:hypothetical protein